MKAVVPGQLGVERGRQQPALAGSYNAAIVKGLQDPIVRERFQRDGAEPAPSESPEAFAALVRAEVGRWQKLVAATSLKPK